MGSSLILANLILGDYNYLGNLYLNILNCALVVRDYIIPTGYKAYILPESIPEEYAKNIASHCPNASILYGVSGTEVLENYDVIEVQETGIVRIVYKDASTDNVLFITNKCNSNCIMCPDADSNRRRDIGARIVRHQQTRLAI